jgi:hypothetical protein
VKRNELATKFLFIFASLCLSRNSHKIKFRLHLPAAGRDFRLKISNLTSITLNLKSEIQITLFLTQLGSACIKLPSTYKYRGQQYRSAVNHLEDIREGLLNNEGVKRLYLGG